MVTPAHLTRHFLGQVHERHAIAPIRYADAQGAFVESLIDAFFGDALSIVPDANVLRSNIGYACRTSRRPVLITGANAGTFRIFCAAHVVQEVIEHGERWASEMGIPHVTFIDRWKREFLPCLRLVDTRDLEELLSPQEVQRVTRLSDPDDRPSVTLALALGAYFLTEDRAARLAVYVNDANAEERRRWLEPLMRGGDAGELWKLIIATMAIPTALVGGLWNLSKSLYEKSPWLLGTALGISIFFGARIKKENYRRLGGFVGEATTYFVESVINPYNECVARFNEVAPPIPSWTELLTSNARDTVLARACLQKLARSRKSPTSARKLAAELPSLGIGQAEKRVRETLRSRSCFFDPYQGQWQVGRAIVTAPP